MRNIFFFSLLVLLSITVNACSAPVNPEMATVQDQITPETAETNITSDSSEALPTKEIPEISKEPAPEFPLLSYSAPDCQYGGLFYSMEAIDELTVKFTLCTPDPIFLSKIASPAFAIQSSDYLEQTGGGKDSALLEAPLGTGPYKVLQWKRGEELVFVANPNYWNAEAAAKTSNLIFRWNSEATQRLHELQIGSVDGIDNPDVYDFSEIKANPDLQLIVRSPYKTFYLGINNTVSPLENELVREAIAMAIDRQELLDRYFPPGFELATHFTPCTIPNGCVGEPWYEFDPIKARELLADAGFQDGFSVELADMPGNREYGGIAQDIQAQLKDNLDIDVTIKTTGTSEFLEAANSGVLPGLYLLGWSADYLDITNFLDFHFGAGASDQFGSKFTDITEALRQGASQVDDAERQPFYVTANNVIKQHIPMVPLAHGSSAVAFKAGIAGAYASPLSNEAFSMMSAPGQDTLVWMQNIEPISLYCADETDGGSLRACSQVSESLYKFKTDGTTIQPNLAKICEPNGDFTVWTCILNENILFHDGSTLDANDVVLSLLVQWDASHPYHTGNTGAFAYFKSLFGAFVNATGK